MNTETKYSMYTFEVTDESGIIKPHTVTAASFSEAQDDMEFILEDGERITNFLGSEVAPQ